MTTDNTELRTRVMARWQRELDVSFEPDDCTTDRYLVERAIEMAIEEARRTVVTPKSPVAVLGGKRYMENAKGALVPIETIGATDLLEDEAVRKIIAYAEDLSAQIGRFKGHTFEDIGSLLALLDQEYGVKRGGRKGNVSFTSFDGTLKVTLQVADQLHIGPEIQAAKALIDECLREWTADSHAAIRALVDRVFNVDKEGTINRSELFMLLRLEIEDERWQRAMQAIRDAIRVIGSKEYVRFYRRTTPTAQWEPITVDIASATAPAAAA